METENAAALREIAFDLLEECRFQTALDLLELISFTHGPVFETGLAEVVCLSRLGRNQEASRLFESLIACVEGITDRDVQRDLLELAATIHEHLPGGKRCPSAIAALEKDAMKYVPRLSAPKEER
jgi:hypothetical protein